MRFFRFFITIFLLLTLTSCRAPAVPSDGVAATTGPVAQFAQAIADGTGVEIRQVITDSVSCLHDYSLSVRQMEIVEASQLVLLSGAGLEAFMDDALTAAHATVDCSAGVPLHDMEGHSHEHHEAHEHGHTHEDDPHIWLDPDRAAQMAENICAGLTAQYPQHADVFRSNTDVLTARLAELKRYGQETLADLSCRDIITFHDGFGYLAEAFDLEILASMEVESGSEASAAELETLVHLVRDHPLPAIFTEINGSDGAASVIHAETGVPVYSLDMAMGGSDYFAAMKQNIDTLKQALQ